jgi:hypothetical protein
LEEVHQEAGAGQKGLHAARLRGKGLHSEIGDEQSEMEWAGDPKRYDMLSEAVLLYCPLTNEIAFQTAVSLAEYEAEKDEEGTILVTEDHLRAVVELSKDFKDYLNELHIMDEDKRAENRFERVANFKEEKS